MAGTVHGAGAKEDRTTAATATGVAAPTAPSDVVFDTGHNSGSWGPIPTAAAATVQRPCGQHTRGGGQDQGDTYRGSQGEEQRTRIRQMGRQRSSLPVMGRTYLNAALAI